MLGHTLGGMPRNTKINFQTQRQYCSKVYGPRQYLVEYVNILKKKKYYTQKWE